MKIACRHLLIAIAVLAASNADVSAQPAPRDRSVAPQTATAGGDASAIANGWMALAQGKPDEAVKAADAVLARRPLDHHAIDLKIEALSHAQPVRALDAYDGWLGRARVEDIFMLIPIARGTLEQIASGDDRRLQKLALQRLARSGDTRAAARLQELAKSDAGASDVEMALEGDAQAATRLTNPKAAAAVQPQVLAKALPYAGPAAVPMLRSLLKHPAAPVRMEAALSLGKLNAVDAIPEIKAMMADPEVRSYAAVALTRLGDPEGDAIVQELLQSPVSDVRLLGAMAYEGKGSGPWVQALMPALQDPNGLTRVRAAELLAPVAPDAARPVLMEAAKDPNPVVRADVMRVIEQTDLLAPPAQAASEPNSPAVFEGALDLATIRRMLRDPDASIRLHAAGSLLALVRAAR